MTQSWPKGVVYSEYMEQNIEPFPSYINQLCAITTTSTNCSLLMLQTSCTTQAYLLKVPPNNTIADLFWS